MPRIASVSWREVPHRLDAAAAGRRAALRNGPRGGRTERHGAHNLPDEVLIQIASAERWVIVTENALDFVHVTTCPVLFVRKRWRPASGLAQRLAVAVGGWADRNPEPGDWPHWLPTNLR